MKGNKNIFGKIWIAVLLSGAGMFLGINLSYAQPRPPRPIKVTINAAQGIQFGAFVSNGSPGTVVINPYGIRSANGGCMLINLNYTFSAAVYSITTIPGTLISVSSTQSNLTGPVPSTPLGLTMGPTDKGASFVATSASFTLNIGGTLTVPANPTAGAYNGSYTVTFIQQ